MRIFQSFKDSIISQGFGKENTSTDSTIVKWYHDLNLLGHNGWDWRGKTMWSSGQPIYWDCDIEGEVTDIFTTPTQGCGVYINTSDQDGQFMHVFWHMQPNIQCKLRKIQSGQLIGYLDNTGQYTTGPHLHRGLYKLPRDMANGYGGAVDIQPFYSPIFILVYLNMMGQITIITKLISFFRELIDKR
jgi:hypothetical protein